MAEDWDTDSPQLQANLARVLTSARVHARSRQIPTAELVKRWHAEIVDGLQVPDPSYRGAFRGEPNLERIGVHVDECWGASPADVAEDVRVFFEELLNALTLLDREIPEERIPGSADLLRMVLSTAALMHAQWVEIHPFANGNGRTARLLANYVLMRYGIPPFVRLRPRPEGDTYADAARRALCDGDYDPTIALFYEMFDAWAASQSTE